MNYTFHREQHIQGDLHEIWDFFSTPENLSLITPPELGFKILQKDSSDRIFSGMKIHYTVRPLAGIPLRWITCIKDVDPYKSFTDVQEKGPYAFWEHKHVFIAEENGVLMKDLITYRLPFSWLGGWIQKHIIAKKLNTIFNYRSRIITNKFNHNGILVA